MSSQLRSLYILTKNPMLITAIIILLAATSAVRAGGTTAAEKSIDYCNMPSIFPEWSKTVYTYCLP